MHFFNSLFIVKLCLTTDGYDYIAVRRWTTKNHLGYDMLECDKAWGLLKTI